jgi:uncharacterized protein (TIGR00730 family)
MGSPRTPLNPGGRLIGVFCASSDRIDASYGATAAELGRELAARGHGLIYGGGNTGLMGHVARAMHGAGGRVVGYIPARLMSIEGRAFDIADELVVTDTMHERKVGIFERADAFVILPGGIGTLEEFLEIVTLRHLGYHDKPIVLLDDDGFYRTLVRFLDETVERGFSPPLGHLFHVARSVVDALDWLDDHLAETPSQ